MSTFTKNILAQYGTPSNLEARIHLHEKYSTNKYGWMPWLFDQLPDVPRGSILDLGCGTGLLWSKNLHRLLDNWKVTLCDLSIGMLKAARASTSALRNRLHFVACDIERLPFSSNSFTTVIANHMLYHVPDLDLALSEVRRILIPGGCFCASTNGLNHMNEIDTIIADFTGDRKPSKRELPFSLSNGSDILNSYFSSVELRIYHDSLSVSDACPLLEYIFSCHISETLQTVRNDFLNYLEDLIDKNGSLHITKESGLFLAVNNKDT
ncbi:class I SAM-dependent methyltransferase [Acidobacteriota bacterium]